MNDNAKSEISLNEILNQPVKYFSIYNVLGIFLGALAVEEIISQGHWKISLTSTGLRQRGKTEMYLGAMLKTKMKRARIIQRSEVRKLRTKSLKIRHVVSDVGSDSSRLHPYFSSYKTVGWVNTDALSYWKHIEMFHKTYSKQDYHH